MATSMTIQHARRDPFKGNLTLGSPFEQPGTTAAAPVPEDALGRLRALTMMAPENDGIIGTKDMDGRVLLTNKPSTIRGMDEHTAINATGEYRHGSNPAESLAQLSEGSRNTFRANRLNRAADEAFDAQKSQQRVTAGAREFERGQRSQDIVANARATGQGETDAFLTSDAREMRNERGAHDLGLAAAKNAGPFADARAQMYAADREAQAREAGIPGQQVRAYADVLGASEVLGENAGPVRDAAREGILRASGQQRATESQLMDFAESRGMDVEDARALAVSRGFVIVQE